MEILINPFNFNHPHPALSRQPDWVRYPDPLSPNGERVRVRGR
jgi:hypothetical protein